MTSRRSSNGSPPPRFGTPRTDRASLGPAVADAAAALGIDLLPWQRHVADVALEHVDGRLVFRDCDIAVPRQSGKTTLLAMVVLHRLLGAPNQRVAYVAQSRIAGRDKLFREFWPLLSRSPLADMFRLRRAIGEEAIEATNGGRWELLSSDEASGHGATLDLAVLDECWALSERTEAALRPAMVTRPQAQIWRFSTAGTTRSVYWHDRVEAGRTHVVSGFTDDVAYFEWSAPPDADPGDPATWRACMPALGHTVSEEVVAKDRAAMKPASEFCRAYLNWLPHEADEGWGYITREMWQKATSG
jgi:phage terminase large subunit-like protein